MTGFLLKRLGFMLVVLVFVSIITFLITRMAPGDPARLLAGPQASAETVARIREEMQLDRPLMMQYASYLQRPVQLDFGVSNATGRPSTALSHHPGGASGRG